jgi:Xaa-Pro aminopeptidase
MQQVLVEREFAPYSGEAIGRGTGNGTGMDPEEELPWIGPCDTTVLREKPDAWGLRAERIFRFTSDGVEALDQFSMRNYR